MHRKSLATAHTEWSRLQTTTSDDGKSKGVDGMLHTVAMLAAEDEKLNSELASWAELEAIMGALSPLAEVLIKAQVSAKTKDSAVALANLFTFSNWLHRLRYTSALQDAIKAGPSRVAEAARAVADAYSELHGNERIVALIEARIRCVNAFVALTQTKHESVCETVGTLLDAGAPSDGFMWPNLWLQPYIQSMAAIRLDGRKCRRLSS